MLACRMEALCRHVLCHAATIGQTRFDERIGSARKESADDGKESEDDGKESGNDGKESGDDGPGKA